MNDYLARAGEWQLGEAREKELVKAIAGLENDCDPQVVEDFALWRASKRIGMRPLDLDDKSRGIAFWIGRTASFERAEFMIRQFEERIG